jgi:site-specific recombinase XerD
MSVLAPLLEAFFTERLQRQRQASPHTIAAYSDTFRLLLTFAQQQCGKEPAAMELADLDAPLIAAFLDHLEQQRGNSARTRNARLAAIHSFFRYLATREPAHLGLIQRVLAIPQKRCDRKLVTALTAAETEVLVATPDRSTWLGRRDHVLLLVAAQTGLRVSELTSLRRADVVLGRGAHVRCRGKGRKERCTPLRKDAAAALRAWLKERPGGPEDPLFPSQRGGHLGRDGVASLVRKYTARAMSACASLARKHVTPHVLRHTAAVDLLRGGVDGSTIALWLGHESPDTTHIYLEADLSLKEQALARTAPLPSARKRYRPPDALLAFLQSL